MHRGYEHNRLFVDEEVRGPFAEWIHRHKFSPEGDGTRMTDHIECLLPGGPAVNFLAGWIVGIQLRLMFHHRHKVTKRFCEIPSLEA